MKTTVNIPDDLMRQVKATAAERGVTVTDLVRAGLRSVIAETSDFEDMPAASLGSPAIDLEDRDQLWDAVHG